MFAHKRRVFCHADGMGLTNSRSIYSAESVCSESEFLKAGIPFRWYSLGLSKSVSWDSGVTMFYWALRLFEKKDFKIIDCYFTTFIGMVFV